jgi:serine/threonine protein kinase
LGGDRSAKSSSSRKRIGLTSLSHLKCFRKTLYKKEICWSRLKVSGWTDHAAERDILEKITSPFIVKLHYAFQTEAKLYFVMDFLNGGELFFHLRKENKFSERRACFYAAQLVEAIRCLH